jgi:hypothetical protein
MKDELIKYIHENNANLDDKKLLEFYEELNINAPLAATMRRDAKARKNYIRYEIGKILPKEVKAKLNADLTLIKEETPATPDTEKNEGEETPLTPIVEKKEGEETPATPEADEPEEEKIQLPEGLSEEAYAEISSLYNNRARLANTLADFPDSDNAGRKAVMDEITALELKIKALTSPTPEKEADTQNAAFDWEKSDETIAKMSKPEKAYYKKQLTEKRSRANTALNEGKEVEKNTRIVTTIDSIWSKLV